MDDLPVEHEDKMETFFMVRHAFIGSLAVAFTVALQSETLKYLYLLFSDDQTIPLSSECLAHFVCDIPLTELSALKNTYSTPK